MLLLSFTSAAGLGTFQVNESMELYQSCPTCSYVNVTTVSTPTTTDYTQTAMVKTGSNFVLDYTPQVNGDYYYIVEGDKDGTAQTEQIEFQVTETGEGYNPFSLGGSIMLLLAFIGLLVFFDKKSKDSDPEKMKDKMMAKYQDKNYIKLVLSTLGYSLMTEKFVLYYLIGLPAMIILANLSFILNISAVVTLMKVLLGIYMWAAILVGLVFFGKLQEIIMDMIHKVRDMDWGIE